MKKFCVILICFVLLSACSTPNTNLTNTNPESGTTGTQDNQPIEGENTNPVTQTGTNTSSSDASLTIIPVNYFLTDQGGGWNEGSVELAFENKTIETISLREYPVYPNFASVQVETVEGVTYDALFTHQYTRYSTQDHYVIPSGFRFIGDDHVEITWKSATAATPKRIVFPDNPEMNFDLPTPQNEKTLFPFDNPPVEYKSFTTLTDTYLVNDSTGITATYTGRCIKYDDYGRKGLEVIVKNNDMFQDQSIPIISPLLYGFMINGVYRGFQWEYNNGYNKITLGPGLSETWYLTFLYPTNTEEIGREIVVWPTDSGYDVYNLDECTNK